MEMAHNLKGDPAFQQKVNKWTQRTAYKYILKNTSRVGDLISSTVGNWQGKELSNKLELEVGKDLQFIRINGTLVGGLVGLAVVCLGCAVLVHWEFALAALGLFLGATSVTAALTNDHHIGHWVYAAVMAICVATSLYFTAHVFAGLALDVDLPAAFAVWKAGIFVSVAFSWIRTFGFLYR